MNIIKMRLVADQLRDSGKYDHAAVIYSEIRERIWCLFGSTQTELSDFSQQKLSTSLRHTIQFKNSYTTQALGHQFHKWFNLDIDQTYNEFVFTTYGRLQCLCNSISLSANFPPDEIYTEFLILYTLILNTGEEEWIPAVNKIAAPVIEGEKLKKIRASFPEPATKKLLVGNAEKLIQTDWFGVNISLLDYLTAIGDASSALFISISKIVGPYAYRHKYQRKKQNDKNYRAHDQGKDDGKGHQYEGYERYERYERYEKYEKRYSKGHTDFASSDATEDQKAKLYGDFFGLSGKVTKAFIRKRYLELISQYHPDKVDGLGPELKELAEQKTKEINIAYDWMKQKYRI